MRDALRSLIVARGDRPDHAGLAYEAWAPVGDDGKVDKDRRERWLGGFEKMPAPQGYAIAFARWRRSFDAGDVLELVARARLLVGHGNPAPTDVGLTLHRTWGVPVLPGSALKGLTAGYVDVVYGADEGEGAPDREPWRGVRWDGERIARGPGGAYRRLFGAPDADDGSDACRGEVIFHDALWIPDDDKLPLARDVLTVHQKGYYGGKGWPNDHDAPNPVAFLTMTPGARFLAALTGPRELVDVARRCLLEALDLWGIGGKTSAGYGRLAATDPKNPKGPSRRE